jgi:hypothetical protein
MIVEEVQEGSRPSARADLYGGLFWIALGSAIAIASWRMDRLERLGVSFFTAPGLMPGILGVVLILFGAVLAARALREDALGSGQRPALLLNRETLRRVGLTLLLSVGFAVGLVGHGLPFWAAAAVYLFAQIAVLEYPQRGRKALVRAALIAPLAAGVIALLFQYVFLVRLP